MMPNKQEMTPVYFLAWLDVVIMRKYNCFFGVFLYDLENISFL